MVQRVLELQCYDITAETSAWSPLHWACRNGDFEVLRDLTDAGVKMSSCVTLEPPGLWTPLDIAKYHRNMNLVSDRGCPLENPLWFELLLQIVSDLKVIPPVPVLPGPVIPQEKKFPGYCDGCQHVSLFDQAQRSKTNQSGYLWATLSLS